MNTPETFSTKTFLRSIRAFMFCGLGLSCIATLANFGLLFLSGWFLAAAAAAGLGGIATQNLFNMFLPAAGVRFFATVRILARYVERLVTHDAALRVTGHIRASSFAAMIPRSLALTTQTRSGDVLARFVSDTERMGQYPLDVILPRQTAFICAVTTVIITALFSLQAAIALGSGLILGSVVLPFIIHYLTRNSAENVAKHREILQSDILESLQGMADILFCGAAQRRLKQIQNQQKVLNHHTFTYALRGHIVRQIFLLLSLSIVLLVIALATQDYQAHHLTGPEIPMLALGTLASFEIIAPLLEAKLANVRIQHAEQRVKALCTLPIPTQEGATEHALPESYTLDFNAVSLNLAERPVLRDLSLHVEEGERVAITGPSGAGKTTLTRLAMRLIAPNSGEISFGGKPLENFTTQILSTRIGLLTQHPHLFHGSLRHNFQIATPEATEEDMLNALKTVGLFEDVCAMSAGLDTLCGEEGIRLSGGQIRRFAAAQILLRRPSLLILDEPTESLPPETGTDMLAGIFESLPHASVLCITHRPEPLSFMHRVLQLEDGQLHKKREKTYYLNSLTEPETLSQSLHIHNHVYENL